MDKKRRDIVTIGGATLLAASTGLSFVVTPEEYLSQCNTNIKVCWGLLSQGNYDVVGEMLRHMDKLPYLALNVSPYQSIAAILATQAQILQMLLSTRNRDFMAREIQCVEAVQFGRISGNRDMLAIALDWQANTYTVCYHDPQKAIPVLNDALSVLNSETSSLTRSGIFSNFSLAYAQEGDEIKARDYLEQAYTAMPPQPEIAPFYESLSWNLSQLEVMVGHTYLYLAEHFPNGNYAQMAYDVLEQSTSRQAVGQNTQSIKYIRKADAARALNELHHFIDCLTQGLAPAIALNNKRRLSQISEVMGRVPESWLQERPVQELQKEIANTRQLLKA